MRARFLAAPLLLLALPAAGAVIGTGVAVLDSTNAQRQSFSTNEKIGFSVAVSVTAPGGATSASRLTFEFDVLAPNGGTVFTHMANSSRGTVGNATSSITMIPISGFAAVPGTYTLNAKATLDGVTTTQSITFQVSSPNILLVYPPNGAANLSDNPLTFQWYSSGATSYRVTVGDNPSLYNALFSQTVAGATTLTYPQNPTDARERLSTGQTYYWNVAGLDSNGNVVAQSQVPFSFSVAKTALARDLAVTGLVVSGLPDKAGNYPLTITVANQGNTTETNTPLRVTMGGVTAPNTPITVPLLSPSDVKTYSVSAPIPPGMTQGMAIACLTIFDDNVSNNCMTLTVTPPPGVSTGTLASAGGEGMTADQIWQAIEQILQGEGIDLSQYNLVNMEGSMTKDQLQALLDQLRQGLAQVNLSGPSATGSADPASFAVPEFSTGTAPAAAAPETPLPAPAVAESTGEYRTVAASTAAAETPTLAQEQSWSGTSKPMGAQTVAVAVKSEAIWKRIWGRLSLDPLPVVDFSQHLVIAISVGAEDPGDRIEIAEYKTEGDTLTVRYRVVAEARPFEAAGRRPAAKAATHFFVGVVPRTVLKVKFDRLRED
jgi:hypothetical protein